MFALGRYRAEKKKQWVKACLGNFIKSKFTTMNQFPKIKESGAV
jgi:hypothetical protein